MGTVKNTAKYAVLANIVQTSFGKQSQKSTHFIKINVVSDEIMNIAVQSIVSYGHQGVWRDLEKKYVDEAVDLIKQAMKKIEEDYKEAIIQKGKLLEPKIEPYLQPAPKTVSVKMQPSTLRSNLVLLSTTEHSERKTAMFKVDCLLEVK